MKPNKLKIVFAGTVGSGKTTAIESISDTATFSTEESATDEVRLIKDTTTVAMDYGKMLLSDGTNVHLYGAPGQRRFDFMWSILAEGALGVVIVINASDQTALDELHNYYTFYSKIIPQERIVICLTHCDKWSGVSTDAFRDYLQKEKANSQLFSMDARNPKEVGAVIKAMLFQISHLQTNGLMAA